MAMTVHAPGFGPATSCVDLLEDLARRHLAVDTRTGELTPDPSHPDKDQAGTGLDPHPVGWIAVDRAYSQAKAADWAQPVRALGYRPIFDYRRADLGRQAEYNGAILVDGRWYSPSIPSNLETATRDYLDRKINDSLWQKRLASRVLYEMRPLAGTALTGTIRWHCPAAGTPGTTRPPLAQCGHKPTSLMQIGRYENRPPVKAKTVAGAVPIVCRQQTITIPAGDHDRFWQDLRHGTPEWQTPYNALRNTVEGRNCILKHGAGVNLADATKRRVRGIAATTFLSAFLLAASNLHRIARFYEQAVTDEDGNVHIPGEKKNRATKKAEHFRAAGATRPVAPPEDDPPDPTTHLARPD